MGIMADGNGNRTKHTINGKSLFRYLREKGYGKTEYARVLWLIHNKYLTPEEAIEYHRAEKNPNWKWRKKCLERHRHYGLPKELCELPDKYIIELGHDKTAKYFYRGIRLRKWCEEHFISYGMIVNRMRKFGLSAYEALQVKEFKYHYEKSYDYTSGKIVRKRITEIIYK
jgi:hypothetical protein